MNNLTQFSGKLYPDKSFTIGIVPKPKIRSQDKQYEREYERQYDSYLQVENKYGNSEFKQIKFFSGYDPLPEVNKLDVTELKERGNNVIDDSSLLVKSPKSSREKRGSYGKHGITGFGRRFVKNACILLERKYGKRRLGFATSTLPGMDRHTCAAINGSISDITRRFYQKIRRKYQKRNLEFIYVGCIEIQEKRFRDSCIPAIHLHFVYLAKESVRSGYTLNTKDFYTAWNESVNECLILLGHKPIMGYGGHIGSVKLESIRTSASAYIGKYLSKGVAVVESMKEKGFCQFPKQWWTACMQCKKMFKESIIHLDTHTCKAFFFGLEEYLHEGVFVWARFVEIEINEEYCKIGCVGTMSSEAYNLMKE